MRIRTCLQSGLAAVLVTCCGGIQQALASVTASVQPPSATVLVGGSQTFTVQVSTTGETITGYSWRFSANNSPPFSTIANAATSVLNLTNIQTTNAGFYFVSVSYTLGTNSGSVSSASAQLIVQDQARIVTQPPDQNLPTGTNATFSVTALGQLPLSYQWRFNSNNISEGGRFSGTRTNTFTISSLITNDSGGYDVVIGNTYAVVTSRVASLGVYNPPVVSNPLSNVTAVVGGNAVFNVTPGGSPPFSYLWLKGGTTLSNAGRVSGANTGALTIASVTTNDAGQYSVIFSNPVGSATSGPVTLAVLIPPVITSAIVATGKQGTAFSYQATATGSPTITFGAQGLPTGLAIDPDSGLLTGIPLVFGPFTVTLFATNPATVSSTNLTLALASDVPGITSSTNRNGKQGQVFTYTIAASNNPVSFTATGLPTGINLNPVTGVISGPPLVSGIFPVTITASNQFGGSSKVLNLTIASAVPVITSPATAAGTENAPGFSYTITATNTPTSYAALDLPAGLTLNTNTGIISGTPIYGGTNTVVIQAANAYGVGSTNLQIAVAYAALPGLAIIQVTNMYSSPYLLDFTFSLRDDPNAVNNPSAGNAVSRPPDQIQVTAFEGNTNTLTAVPVGSETAVIVNRAITSKQLQTFFVLDYTFSMFDTTNAINDMQSSVEGLIDQEPPSAQFGVVEFNADFVAPAIVTGFTSDKNLLTQDIQGIQTNFVQGNYAGSRFYDALYLALNQFTGTNTDQLRYLVIMSDGDDDSSVLLPTTNSPTLPDVIVALAQTNDVAIYCVGFGPDADTNDLMQMTSQTGGRYYSATTAQQLGIQFDLLLKDLNSQYLLRWATLQRGSNAFQPMFEVTVDGQTADFNTNFDSSNMVTVNTNSTPPVTNTTTTFISLVPFYTNSLYAGPVTNGLLTLLPDAASNISSITLRTTYMPRFVRELRLDYRPNFPCTPVLLNTGPGDIFAGWTLTQTNDGAGGQLLTLTSPDTNNLLTSLPYGILSDLVTFQFQYQAIPLAQEAFSVFTVDNTIYSNMPPGNQSFTLTNSSLFITNLPPPPPHGTPVPWLASYGFTNNPATDELLPSPNGNGLELWQDYIAGLNPTNAASTFAILPSSVLQPGVPPVITFATVLGRTYRVDSAITPGDWTTLLDGIVGTGFNVSITDNRNLSGINSIYYRLSVSY